MKKLATYVFALVLAWISLGCGQGEVADTVYTNGRIYTVNEAQPWVEAAAIKDGKFLVVGSNADVEAVTGEDTEVVDLGGKFVMPGIHDTHVHPTLVYSYEEGGELLFPESLSKEEVLDVLREYVAENPDKNWIRGQKWSTTLFPGGRATKAFLDAAVPDRPVMLLDETGHNAVANSMALELAGITKDTPDPDFGAIERDPNTGEPTGYLSETGIGLIGRHVQRPDTEAFYRGTSKALEEIRPYGTTSIIDMMAGKEAIMAYRRLEDEGKLNFRVRAAIPLNDFAVEMISPEEAEDLLQNREQYASHLVNVDNLKYWADGTPFSHTSLLLEPYTDQPDTHGEMTIGPKQYERILQAHKEGIQVHLHTVGDGTTRELLNLIETARQQSPQPTLRHHLGHLMLVDSEDIPRFKELNVAAEFSPVLWYPAPLTRVVSTYVGEDRVQRWQPIREFIDAGVIVSFGSDWPAGTPDADPWRGLEAMITRMDPKGDEPGKVGDPIDLATGIEILTLGGAKTMMQETSVGSIENGKYADMIILDRNPFEIEVEQISDVKVLSTVFEGKEVYKATAQ